MLPEAQPTALACTSLAASEGRLSTSGHVARSAGRGGRKSDPHSSMSTSPVKNATRFLKSRLNGPSLRVSPYLVLRSYLVNSSYPLYNDIWESLDAGPCPAGHYCPEGTKDPLQCQNATVRCDRWTLPDDVIRLAVEIPVYVRGGLAVDMTCGNTVATRTRVYESGRCALDVSCRKETRGDMLETVCWVHGNFLELVGAHIVTSG